MPSISLTLPVAGTVITAGLHASNYTALQTLLNGGLDTANWAAGKIFAPSKLMQEGATAGQHLEWNPTATQWVPSDGYGTALPGSPYDGQTFTLVDSTSAPTYAFRLRYNSTLAKWEFLGGRQKAIQVTPNAVLNTLTQVGATGYYRNTGTDFVVPYGGVWRALADVRMDPNGVGGTIAATSFLQSALANDLAGASTSFSQAAAGNGMELVFEIQIPGAAAGNTIGVAASASTPGTHKLIVQSVFYWPDKIV